MTKFEKIALILLALLIAVYIAWIVWETLGPTTHNKMAREKLKNLQLENEMAQERLEFMREKNEDTPAANNNIPLHPEGDTE